MKNILVAGIVLAALGYLLFRRSAVSARTDIQLSNPMPQQHVGVLDMEHIIEWFMTHRVADFMTPGILAVAVNLKTLTETTKPSSEFAPILSQIPSEHETYPEAILLGFFDKAKGELMPVPYALMFTADALTPALTNHFKDKAILIFE